MRAIDHVARPVTVALACGALLLGACGDDGSEDEPSSASTTAPAGTDTSGDDGGGEEEPASSDSAITISDFTYEPSEVSVSAGAEVTVSNEDGVDHTATSTRGGFDSGSVAGGEEGSFTAPTEPGEYPFICNFHPTMEGTLVVG